VKSSCEHGNEPSASVKFRVTIEWHSAPQSELIRKNKVLQVLQFLYPLVL
jgi:hypothetical protein